MKTLSETGVRLVSASAGSGKTYRLTQILEERIRSGQVRPEALVATTFTIKAAAELQERVRSRLLAAGCHDQALRLGAARIGTVNSVCSRLVSDFALDLGLSPDLRVLDDAAAKRAFRRALSRVMTSEDHVRLAGLSERMVAFDWTAAVDTVVRLARDNGLSSLEESRRRSLEGLSEMLLPAGEAGDDDLLAALLQFQRRVDVREDTTQNTEAAVDRVDRCVHRLQRGRSLAWRDWASLARLETGAKSRPLAAPVQAAAAAHDWHPQFRQDVEAAVTLVFDLAERSLAAYQEFKRSAGVLDFSDQEVLALGLLRDPGARDLLRAELDLVLVDEFQDTSPLQLAIFLELASLAGESVWVGDQKQAIYAFRGTDPALMDAAIASLKPDTLGKSYRSRPELVRLTSQVFAQALADQLPEERVALEPAVEEPPGLGPCLEYWRLAEKGSANLPVHERLATTVKAFLADPTSRVRDPRTKEVRRARPGDVAVLCFRNATCRVVARELELRGVPAALPRQGLLKTSEGLLVLAGLRLWADPADTLARAELARLTCADPDAWLQAVLVGRREAFDAHDLVQRVLARREELRHAGPVTVLEAVLEAVDAPDWCLSWGNCERRLANLEALRGLALDYVEECRAEGRGCTPAGLVGFLGELRRAEEDEQARVAGEDAVTVTTWHGAKGLEWPVTVLYDLDQRPRAAALGVTVVSDRAAFDVEDPLGGRWIRYWPTPFHPAQTKAPLLERLKDHPATAEACEKERRERLRLLYVGWTRARDVLVVAGRPRVFGALPLALLAGSDGGALVSEPSGGSLCWAGVTLPVTVREEETVGPDRLPLVAGEAPVARGSRSYPPAVVLPSAAAGAGVAALAVEIGPRVALVGSPDMRLVGEAVHTFLAAGRADLELASECLARWGVAEVLSAADLVGMSARFTAWVESRWPGAVWHRELPLSHRLSDGSLVLGVADLVLETRDGLVLVDHKTFPGGREQAVEAARGYAGQLGAYASACEAALGRPVGERWIHLGLSGTCVRLV